MNGKKRTVCSMVYSSWLLQTTSSVCSGILSFELRSTATRKAMRVTQRATRVPNVRTASFMAKYLSNFKHHQNHKLTNDYFWVWLLRRFHGLYVACTYDASGKNETFYSFPS